MAAITRDILGAWSQISGCLGCSSLWLPAILSHLTVFHFYNSQSIKCRRALWDVVKMFKIPLLPSKETSQSQFSVGAFLHLPPAQTAGTSDVRGGFVSPLTQPLLLCLGVHPGKDSYRLIKKKKKKEWTRTIFLLHLLITELIFTRLSPISWLLCGSPYTRLFFCNNLTFKLLQ